MYIYIYTYIHIYMYTHAYVYACILKPASPAPLPPRLVPAGRGVDSLAAPWSRLQAAGTGCRPREVFPHRLQAAGTSCRPREPAAGRGKSCAILPVHELRTGGEVPKWQRGSAHSPTKREFKDFAELDRLAGEHARGDAWLQQ